MRTKKRAAARVPRPDEALFRPSARKAVPFDFVLAELASLEPRTRPMFSCVAVYVDELIVFCLRDRPTHPKDNGVWLATVREHHESLRAELPCMRSITVLAGGKETGWQILPADAAEFEDAVMRACEMVLRRDPRIGKVPKARRPRTPRATTSSRRG